MYMVPAAPLAAISAVDRERAGGVDVFDAELGGSAQAANRSEAISTDTLARHAIASRLTAHLGSASTQWPDRTSQLAALGVVGEALVRPDRLLDRSEDVLLFD